jgi:hypothetical protein
MEPRSRRGPLLAAGIAFACACLTLGGLITLAVLLI